MNKVKDIEEVPYLSGLTEYVDKKYMFPAMDWKNVRALYNQFTAEDKKLMNRTPEFEETLITKLNTH